MGRESNIYSDRERRRRREIERVRKVKGTLFWFREGANSQMCDLL